MEPLSNRTGKKQTGHPEVQCGLHEPLWCEPHQSSPWKMEKEQPMSAVPNGQEFPTEEGSRGLI